MTALIMGLMACNTEPEQVTSLSELQGSSNVSYAFDVNKNGVADVGEEALYASAQPVGYVMVMDGAPAALAAFVLHPFWVDTDGDGYGKRGTKLFASEQPVGYAPRPGDCNDSNAGMNPGETEICDNGVDDDCRKLSVDPTTVYYADTDIDTYGNVNSSITQCGFPPSGYVTNSSDCDDTDEEIKPGKTEDCNGVDDDCDGVIDDGLSSSTFYADEDGDNYGDSANSVSACAAPSGYVSDNTDCNDSNAAVNPGATEDATNGIDDDCDGVIDGVEVCADFNSSVAGGELMVRVEHADGTKSLTYWGVDSSGNEWSDWTSSLIATEVRGSTAADDQLSELIYVSTAGGSACATIPGVVSTDILVINGLVRKTDGTYYWVVGASFTYLDSLSASGASITAKSGNDYWYEVP